MGDMIIDLLNGIIETIGNTLQTFIESIPWHCPFDSLQNALNGDLLGMVNYFIPIPEMIAMLETWGISIGIWYIIAIPLRWFKGKNS